MPDRSSTRPGGKPDVPERIAEGLRAAVAEPSTRPGAFVRLVASGGVRSERYEFEYRIDASGNISTWLHDELRERHVEGQRKQEVRADPDAFRALVESIDVDALLREESPAAGFPPDSVVGRLEISDGEQSASFAFLADYQQASRAGRQANESLRRVVDAIYRSAAAHLDTEDLAP